MKYLLFLALLFLPFRTEAQTATINCTVPISLSGTFQCPVTVTVPVVPPPVVTPPIVIPPVAGTCPMGNAFPDGCATAPLNAVTPRHAGTLASYGTNRPKWNMAGSDYEVGLDKTLTLTDWHGLPTAVVGSAGTQYVRCTSGAMVLDKIDFTKGGGSFVYIGAGDTCTSLKITRSKMGCDSINQNGPGNVALVQVQKVIPVTIEDSDIDLGGCLGIGGGQVAWSFGSLTFTRVHFANMSQSNPLNQGGCQFAYAATQGATNQNVTVQSSWLGECNNVNSGAHNNMVQWAQIAAGNSLTFKWNSYVQTINNSSTDQGGEMVQTYQQGGTVASPGKLTAGDVSNNTIICKRSATNHTTCSNAFNGGGAGCAGTCIFDSNWMDASGAFSYSYGRGNSTGWVPRSGSSPFFALGTGAPVGFTP